MPAKAGIQPFYRESPFARMNGTEARYVRTYFCTRQFSVSATKISSRGLTAM